MEDSRLGECVHTEAPAWCCGVYAERFLSLQHGRERWKAMDLSTGTEATGDSRDEAIASLNLKLAQRKEALP